MQRSFLRILAFLALAFSLVACTDRSSSDSNSPDSNYELRVYAVSAENSGEIARDIQRLLTGPSAEGTSEQAFFGRVQTLPNGNLAVLALESVHRDLEEVFADAEQDRIEPVAAHLQFWMVRANPSEQTRVPEELSSLERALSDVATQTGPVDFALIEHLRQRSDVDQQWTTISGSKLYANSNQKLIGNKRIALDLNLRALNGGPSINTKLTLQDGETVLLAQTGSEDSDVLYIFVARVDLI